MKIAQKFANQRFGGMSMTTFTNSSQCQHRNGWYVTVPFWIFSKRIFVCSDCGHYKEAS